MSVLIAKEWFESSGEIFGNEFIYITDHFRDIRYSQDQFLPDFPSKIKLPDGYKHELIDILSKEQVLRSKYPFPPFFSFNNPDSAKSKLAVYRVQKYT